MRIETLARHLRGLDGVRELESGGLRRWYVDGRLVARQEDEQFLVVRADFDDRERLLTLHPETFSVPPRMEAHQKVLADTSRGNPDAIRAALTAAWELQRRGK
jgi:hypothetical protein